MFKNNIYSLYIYKLLLQGGWDQTSSRSSSSDHHTCAKPSGGQLPPPLNHKSNSNSWGFGESMNEEQYGLEVSFIVSVLLHEGALPHIAASIALEAAIALFRHADVSTLLFILISLPPPYLVCFHSLFFL